MYQALYRKYRPSTFEDVCGQEHITSVLKTQLKNGRISHAYMFCGSRGTGKTTCAKILAKAVNCENPIDGEPCNQCSSCIAINEERVLDVVEMDAASNNGVDHIRRLCDEVQFLPSEAKKRVYIIDEVHMLSTSAFNALLKTIEEPPAHVLFILATTEMNDIPATIMSRCQRFDFKRITPEVITKRLLKVAENEGLALKAEAAAVIARLSDGAMRDALSLLEACQGYQGEISAEKIHSILGLGSRESILALCRAIAEQNVSKCLSLVRDIYEKMSDFKEIIGELISLYRDLLVIKTVSDYENYVEGYENEIPTLVEISKLLSLETVLYQVKEMEEFYISYDRISTGKRASSEVLLIRLCNEALSQDMNAILSRLSKLESGTVVISNDSGNTNDKSIAKDDEPSPSSQMDANVTSRNTEINQRAKTEFEGSLKLKNLLQNVPYIKPWIPQISFSMDGNRLHLIATPFVNGLLLSSDAKETVLQAAQKIDPSIADVLFVESSQSQQAANVASDFEGL